MNPGIYPDLSNHDYHHGDGVSKSGLDLVNVSPLHLRHKQTAANDEGYSPTAAQAIGTAFHALILEPHLFVSEYTLALRQSDYPAAIDGRDQLVAMVAKLNEGRWAKLSTSGSKAEQVERIRAAEDEMGIQCPTDPAVLSGAELKARLAALNDWRPGLYPTTGTIAELAAIARGAGLQFDLWSELKAQWAENNGHRNVLTTEGWDQLHRMRDAVMAHPAARALMSRPGKAEQSVYWIDPTTGELCRCRPDFWTDCDLVVDVKTCDDASPEGFAHSIQKWRYHVQDAFYTDGLTAAGRPPRAFLFLAVEKDACVVDGQAKGVAVYALDAESRELGRAQYRENLAQYAQCRQSGKWPGYGEKVQPIGLPVWFLNRNADKLGAA